MNDVNLVALGQRQAVLQHITHVCFHNVTKVGEAQYRPTL